MVIESSIAISLEGKCVVYSAAFAEFIHRKVANVNTVFSFLLITPGGLFNCLLDCTVSPLIQLKLVYSAN